MEIFIFIVAPLLIFGALLGGGIAARRQGKQLLGNILLFTGLTFGWLLGAFVLNLWTEEIPAVRSVHIYPLVFLIFGLFVFAICIFTRLKKSFKRSLVILLAVSLIGTGTGLKLYQRYYDAVPKVEANENLLYQYLPYGKKTKIVSLTEASTLRLTDKLPVLDGATALFPVYAAFAKAVYPQSALDNINPWELNAYQFPHVLKCTTTTGAYESIINGTADIIFAAEPSEKQKQAAANAGVELVYTPIGREAFVFFVNAKNPIENLSTDTVKQIYSGAVTKWKELGVKHLGTIVAFQRNEDSGSQSALKRLIGDIPLMEAPTDREILDMGGIIEKTSDYKNFKNAIGYSFRFYCNEMVGSKGIKLLRLDGIAPTVVNIANGTYPQTSSFYAVTRRDANENVRLFLEWITGPQGQALVEKTGYVPEYSAKR